MNLKSILFGLAAALALPGAASATDLFMAEDSYVAPAEVGFDWQGFYLGVYAGIEHLPQGLGFGDTGVGKVVGFNLTAGDMFLVGLEGRAGAYFDGGYDFPTVVGSARAGFVLADDWLIYATAGGAYTDFGGGAWLVESLFGGGVEYAVGDHVTVRGEVTHRECVDGNVPCLVGGINHIDGAVLWHLN